MKSDPRACKIPMTEFNHMSLAEIDDLNRLERRGYLGLWRGNEGKLWAGLVLRRVNPDRGHKGDAA